MGSEVSRPHRYYVNRYGPADTLRRCGGGPRCYCGHRHEYTRYYYCDPRGLGTPQRCDPYGYIVNGRSMPNVWKDPSEWTLKDFEVMGIIFSELDDRLGRQVMMNGRTGSYLPGVDDMSNGLAPWLYDGSGGSHSHPMILKLRDISLEHSRRLAELEDFTGVSDRAMRADAYKRRMQDMVNGLVLDRALSGCSMPAFNQMVNQSGSNLPTYLMGGYNEHDILQQRQQQHPFAARFNGNGAPRPGHRQRTYNDEAYEPDEPNFYWRR